MLFDSITHFTKNGIRHHQLTTGDYLLFFYRGNRGDEHYSYEVVFRTCGGSDICAVHNQRGYVQHIVYLPITYEHWPNVLASRDRLAERLKIDFVQNMDSWNLRFDVKPRT